MREKVLETIKRFSMILPGERILAAVSGGPDSVALLVVLSELREDLGFDLAVAHFHHGLRKTAERDLEFVRRLAADFNLEFFWAKEDVSSLAEKRGLGLEEAARHARYRFLERIKNEKGFDKVALGHTLDDNVETFFMRIIRGGSLEGLKGIPPVRSFWIRPLIEVERSEILNFLKEKGVSFVLDETNEDESFLRNWIRLKLIPLLMERNPSIRKTVSVILGVLREEYEFLEEKTEKFLSKLSYSFENDELVIELKDFRNFPRIIKRNILFKLLYRFFYPGLPNAVGFAHVEGILAMINEKKGTKMMSLPMGVRAYREYDRLVFTRKLEEQPDEEVVITAPGLYCFGDFVFEVAEGDFSSLIVDGRWHALFDAEKLKFPLVLRYKKPGDRILIKGVGRKKLQDFFVDLKVPRRERSKIPLLVTPSGEVLWIVGYRQREDLKPAGGRGILIKAVRSGT